MTLSVHRTGLKCLWLDAIRWPNVGTWAVIRQYKWLPTTPQSRPATGSKLPITHVWWRALGTRPSRYYSIISRPPMHYSVRHIFDIPLQISKNTNQDFLICILVYSKGIMIRLLCSGTTWSTVSGTLFIPGG